MQQRTLYVIFSLFAATLAQTSCSQACGTQNCCATPSGTQCYYQNTHTCAQDSQSNFYVCPTGYSSCAGACYLPKDYCCPNGQLTQASACTTQTPKELPSFGNNFIVDGDFPPPSANSNGAYATWNFAYYGGATYNQPSENGLRLGDVRNNVSQVVSAPARPLVLSFLARGGASGDKLVVLFNGQVVFTQNGAFPSSELKYFSVAVNGNQSSFVQFTGTVQSSTNSYYVDNVFLGLNPDYYPLADGNYIVNEAFVNTGSSGNGGRRQTVYTPANVTMTLSFTVNAGEYPYDNYYFEAAFNSQRLVAGVRLPKGNNNFSFQVQSAANGINTFAHSLSSDGRTWSVYNIVLKKN